MHEKKLIACISAWWPMCVPTVYYWMGVDWLPVVLYSKRGKSPKYVGSRGS
jgi:hypothetical protein